MATTQITFSTSPEGEQVLAKMGLDKDISSDNKTGVLADITIVPENWDDDNTKDPAKTKADKKKAKRARQKAKKKMLKTTEQAPKPTLEELSKAPTKAPAKTWKQASPRPEAAAFAAIQASEEQASNEAWDKAFGKSSDPVAETASVSSSSEDKWERVGNARKNNKTVSPPDPEPPNWGRAEYALKGKLRKISQDIVDLRQCNPDNPENQKRMKTLLDDRKETRRRLTILSAGSVTCRGCDVKSLLWHQSCFNIQDWQCRSCLESKKSSKAPKSKGSEGGSSQPKPSVFRIGVPSHAKIGLFIGSNGCLIASLKDSLDKADAPLAGQPQVKEQGRTFLQKGTFRNVGLRPAEGAEKFILLSVPLSKDVDKTTGNKINTIVSKFVSHHLQTLA